MKDVKLITQSGFSFFQKTIKEFLKITTGFFFLDTELSEELIPTIDFFFQSILSDSLTIMKRSKKKELSLYDLENAISGKPFKALFFSLTLFFKKISKKSHLLSEVPFFSKRNKEDPVLYKKNLVSVFLFQKWFFPEKKSKSYSKFKNIKKLLHNTNRNIKFSDTYHLFLSPRQKIFIGYILSKLEKGSVLEQEICIESLVYNPNLNEIAPVLISHLNIFIAENKKFPGKIVIGLKFIRCLLSNISFNLDFFFQELLPIFTNCITGKLDNEGNENFWKIKIYSSNLMGYYCNKLDSRRNVFHQKILKLFLKIVLLNEKSFSLIFGGFMGLSFLGFKIVELVVIPNSLYFFKKKRIKQPIKLLKTHLGLTKLNQLFNIIFLSYLMRKEILFGSNEF